MHVLGSLLVIVTLVLAFSPFSPRAATAQTINVLSPFTSDWNTSAAWYDYGKYVAYNSFFAEASATTEAVAMADLCGSQGYPLYPITIAGWTICTGTHTGRVDFAVGTHDVTATLNVLATNPDAHIFAPTFNEESVSASLNASQWTFTHPTLRTEAAAMLWQMYRTAPNAANVMVVSLDTSALPEVALQVAQEIVDELTRLRYKAARWLWDSSVAPEAPYDVVLLVGTFGGDGTRDLAPMLTTSFTKQLIASSALQSPSFLGSYTAAGSDPTTVPPLSFVSYMPFAQKPVDARFAAIRAAYDAALVTLNAAPNKTLYSYARVEQAINYDVVSAPLLAGFADMSAFLTALTRIDPTDTVSPTTFTQQLHALFTFGYKDQWLLGPVTGPCTGSNGPARQNRLAQLGLSCGNNQAGHRLVYVALTVTSGPKLTHKFLPMSEDFVVPPNARTMDITNRTGSYTPGRHLLRLRSLDVAVDPLYTPSMRAILTAAFPALALPLTTDTAVYFGVLPAWPRTNLARFMKTSPLVLYVDPIDPMLAPRYNVSNAVYFSSTTEQELHVLANYVTASLTNQSLPLAVQLLNASDWEWLPETLILLEGHGLTVTLMDPTNPASEPKHVVVLGGLPTATAADADSDDATTTTTTTTTPVDWSKYILYMPYDELAIEYDAVKNMALAGNGGPVTYFASSLPPWRSDSTTSMPTTPDWQPAVMQAYKLAMPTSSSSSPLLMKMFYTMTVVNELLQPLVTTSVNPAQMQLPIYVSAGIPHNLRTRSVNLGPYVQSLACSSDDIASGACSNDRRLIKNYGAQSINVWSLANGMAAPVLKSSQFMRYVDDHYEQMINPPQRPSATLSFRCRPPTPATTTTTPTPTTTTTTTAPSGPSRPPSGKPGDKNKLSVSALIGIAVGCGCLAAIIVAALIVYYCCCYVGNTRDNGNAPKDTSRPVTLLFTDIQSSTSLWALAPREMADALVTHHEIIRRLIVRYKCYEVKTVGDAFMIACDDAFVGAQLAREIQLALQSHNWGTARFDEWYQSVDTKNAAAGAAFASDETLSYSDRWNGLRVRIGMHTGFANIEHDAVSKGYDYYGDTPNTAARTEALAHGGQVVLTEFAVNQLDAAQLQVLDLHGLGQHYLRGVAGPIHMFQLTTVPGRVFPAIVTDPKDACVPGLAGSPQEAGDMDDPRKNSGASMKPGVGMMAEIDESAMDQPPDPEHVQTTRDVLDAFFGPYDVRRRIKLLRKLSKHVGLVVPRRVNTTDDLYASTLMDALCVHTTKVLDMKRAIEATLNNPDVDLDSEVGSMTSAQRGMPREGSTGALALMDESAVLEGIRERRRRSSVVLGQRVTVPADGATSASDSVFVSSSQSNTSARTSLASGTELQQRRVSEGLYATPVQTQMRPRLDPNQQTIPSPDHTRH